MPFHSVPTPCVGICSTTYGDSVCRGCRRYLHEVIHWNRFQESEKRLVWQRLDNHLAQVLPRYFDIHQPQLLQGMLRQLRIPIREQASAWTWLQALLKACARQAPDLQQFGVTRLDSSTLTLAELRDSINAELHTLAEAYYDRDLLRAIAHP